MGIRVGIDLGTTFCAVARINEKTGKPEVIPTKYGKSVTPSVLCFMEDGTILYGDDAKYEQEDGNPNTVAYFKRYMGEEGFSRTFFGKSYSATDLSAILLKELVKEVEENCGEKIISAVITVPAYFTDKERRATLEAGKKAGINVQSIIHEPTAAAFAYGLNKNVGKQKVIIYDLGGGTFDVTVAEIDSDNIRVLGCDGDHNLGGKDWDDSLADYMQNEFLDVCGVDMSDDFDNRMRLLVLAEKTKKKLTSSDEVSVPLSYNGKKMKLTITEDDFRTLSYYQLNQTKVIVNRLLESLDLEWQDITGVILVGGSTRMRMVHDFVKDSFGRDAIGGVNVDEAVALGAAIRANIDDDGCALPAVGGSEGTPLIMTISGAKKVTDATAHAMGMIARSSDNAKFINSVIIPKNTSIPAEEKKEYRVHTTNSVNETEVYVLQGDFERPLDNLILNKYIIYDITQGTTDYADIEISYKYTSDGIVEVRAKQKKTGKELPVRIERVPEDMTWTDQSPAELIPNVSVMLSIDVSGSMRGHPLEMAKQAMHNFVEQMAKENVKIGIQVFSERSLILSEPISDYFELHKLVNGIDIGMSGIGCCTSADPFRDIDNGFCEKWSIADKNVKKYCVVLTDGVWDYPKESIVTADKCRVDEIEIIALGFGDADKVFLERIADSKDKVSLTNLAGLAGSFTRIAQTIGDKCNGSGLKMVRSRVK